MTKRNLNSVSRNKEEPPKVPWDQLLDIIKNAKEKFGWITAILIGVFTIGFGTGKFYESLMSKFTIQDLERKHSDEIQKIQQEHLRESLLDMKNVQNKLDNASQSGKDKADEK